MTEESMVTMSAQIACVRREIAMRRAVYPKWVASGRLKQDAAERELAAMEAVLGTLQRVRAQSEEALT